MTVKPWMDPTPNAGTREVVRLAARHATAPRDFLVEAARCESMAWGIVRALLMTRHLRQWSAHHDMEHVVRELRAARVWRELAAGLGGGLP